MTVKRLIELLSKHGESVDVVIDLGEGEDWWASPENIRKGYIAMSGSLYPSVEDAKEEEEERVKNADDLELVVVIRPMYI